MATRWSPRRRSQFWFVREGRLMQRQSWRRLRTLLFVVLLLAVASGCSYTVGCKTYTLFEPPTFQLTIDESACSPVEPPPVIPEVPTVLLLPAAALGAMLVGRRLIRARG
jgi:hypothetical protein